jgi:hypothetical protein
MKKALAAVALLAGAATAVAAAQRPFGGFGFPSARYEPRVKTPDYTGQFTFARVRYTPGPNGYYYHGLPAWAHGYLSAEGGNRAEQSLMKIMDEVSNLAPRIDLSAVYALDDPELYRYPVAYLSEPGFWTMDDDEAAGLRAYLLKGGFIIFDDFRHDGDGRAGGGWANLEENMRRALPELRPIPLDPTASVFHSFFEIDSFDIVPQAYAEMGRPEFYGYFERNDPAKRMMAVVNYSTDVAQYWEFSATGFRPIDESNEAYKLGVNYIIYGLTH